MLQTNKFNGRLDLNYLLLNFFYRVYNYILKSNFISFNANPKFYHALLLYTHIKEPLFLLVFFIKP